ncbi:pyridoxal phosphate-dependent aminotransferase [Candidatus Omnitrophota bacterium]
MYLSKRVLNVSPSATLEVTALAKKLKSEGHDVVNFAAGEPDFDTPQEIKNAAKKAIDEGFTKYTPSIGFPSLREEISLKFKRENGLQYSPEQIIVGSGAKHCLYNILQAIAQENDEVIIPRPYWVSYPEMAKLSAATAVFVETTEKNNFKIQPKDLLGLITKKTKALILNSPSNPTGCIYDAAELKEIADICVNKKILVISDEIYEKLIYDNIKHVSIGSFNDKILQQTITVNGVSKAYSMTGWRIGYLGAPLEIAKAIKKIQDHSTSNPASISQKAALQALQLPAEQIEQMRSEFEKRRDYILSRLDGIKNIAYCKPLGAFYVFCDISKISNDTKNFAKKFLEEKKVALIPGIGFGKEGWVRMSFATNLENIEKGMDRLEAWVKQLQKKS